MAPEAPLLGFDLIVEYRWSFTSFFEIDHYSDSLQPARYYEQYPPIVRTPHATYVHEVRIDGRFERADWHTGGTTTPFQDSFLDSVITCTSCPGYDPNLAQIAVTARHTMNDSKPLALWIVIVAVAGLSLLPAAFIWFSPDFYNPLTAYLLSVLLMAIPLALGVSSSQTETTKRIIAAEAEAARNEKDRWLPQAQSACDRLLTIRASASILKDSLACGCSNIQTVLEGMSEEQQRLVRQVFDGHCEACLSSITSVINHLEGGASDWERFIRRNCAEGECEQIFGELDQTKQSLDTTVREARARRVAQQRADGCVSGAELAHRAKSEEHD